VHVVAFDMMEGREVLISEVPTHDAIAAASALPGIFPPVQIGERRLIDGGVVNNTPISHAIELGAELIYVLPTDDPQTRALPGGPRGALDAAVHAFTLLLSARLQADLARYANSAEIIVLPAVNPHHVQPTDFDHASRLIGDALSVARTVLRGDAAAEPVAA
jgi:NTE family protein